jgi:hypothetical protein
MVEIKKIGKKFDLFNILKYDMWQHDIGHYKLVTSCMIVT